MAQVTDERLAELIAHCDDLLPYNEAKWRDHQSALRELQQIRKLRTAYEEANDAFAALSAADSKEG